MSTRATRNMTARVLAPGFVTARARQEGVLREGAGTPEAEGRAYE